MVYITRVATLVLFLFSSLALVTPNVANGGLYILFFLGIVLLVTRSAPDGFKFSSIFRSYWPLILGMTALLLAVFFHQLASAVFLMREYDRPFRVAIFGVVFFAILSVPLRQLMLVQWAWIVCAIAVFIKGWYFTDGGNLPNTGSLGFMTGIGFSNMALLIGTWILLSICWFSKSWSIVLKIAASILALYVTYMLKTRGTWLALPFFSIFFIWYFKTLKGRYKLAILLFPTILLVGIFSQNEMVKKRLYDVKSDVIAYQNGTNRDTSVGQRLELWKASFLMFKDHPGFGVGRENFKKELSFYADKNEITRSIVEMPHSHNGVLFHMALWGIGGLIAWILTYLVPLFYFCKELRHPDSQVRTPAAMGVILCLGFWVFDLTDVMFFWVMLNSFYVVNMALFLACIVKRKRDLAVIQERKLMSDSTLQPT